MTRKPARLRTRTRLLRGGRARRARTAASRATKAAKSRSGAATRRRDADIARLAAELDTARARIAELETRIEIDPLTETLNRRGFERELARSLAYVERYGVSAALLYLDLDSFKPVNDRHGHAAGDAVLKAIAAALLGEVRASDVVARIGGDEFVVLLWNVSAAEAIAKALALETVISGVSIRWKAATIGVGASAGVAVMRPSDTPAKVLGRADAAMYARKRVRKA